MRRLVMVGLLAVLSAVGMAGCSSRGDAKDQAASAGRPAVAVEVMAALAADLTEEVEVVGALTPKFEAEVKSEIPGLIREVYVTEWVRVKKGTPLARIDTREIDALASKAEASMESARAGLMQAEVAGKRAEREYGRMLQLKEAGLATQQGLDDAETEKAAAVARIDAAKAQLRAADEDLRHARARLSKGVISAPLDGVVALRDVNVGDLASDTGAAKTLFRIVDNRLLNLTVNVPSTEMSAVRVGQSINFTTDAEPGKTFTGRVMYVNPAVNEVDRSVKVIAEVRNVPEQLKGGLFAKGRIVTGARRKVLQVPRGALAGWDMTAKKGRLFVVEGNLARQREVATGAVAGDQVEIAAGLKPAEQLVIRGGFNLKDGDRVNVVAAQ